MNNWCHVTVNHFFIHFMPGLNLPKLAQKVTVLPCRLPKKIPQPLKCGMKMPLKDGKNL
ncbi:MAG: hypothetical protein IJZ19_10680 [Lentisphaeria bacterium]|nr:hypothetical protein [Lentisphaeria bacterium]